MSLQGRVSDAHAQVGLARWAAWSAWRLAKVAPSRNFDCEVRLGGHVRSTALVQRSIAHMPLAIRRIYVTHCMSWYEREREHGRAIKIISLPN